MNRDRVRMMANALHHYTTAPEIEIKQYFQSLALGAVRGAVVRAASRPN
jgi:hypothetical protein